MEKVSKLSGGGKNRTPNFRAGPEKPLRKRKICVFLIVYITGKRYGKTRINTKENEK